MKQRFSSLDVRAIGHELNTTLAGTRLNNIYDLVPPAASSSASSSGNASSSASRSLLLRFSRGQDKFQLVVDSGFRCHLTTYDARAAAAGVSAAGNGGGGGGGLAPSAFVSRLRTFLSGRLLDGVVQVGAGDRVLELRFSDARLRLYLEFFAAGNVILTNQDASKVLAVQRTVAAFRSASLDVTLSVGAPYALGIRGDATAADASPDQGRGGKALPLLTLARVRGILETAVASDAAASDTADLAAARLRRNSKKKKTQSLSQILASALPDLSQVLVEHAFLCNGISTTTTDGTGTRVRPSDILADEARLQAVLEALQKARKFAEDLTKAGPQCEGYIMAMKRQDPIPEADGAQHSTKAADAAASTQTLSGPPKEDLDYVDFHPFRPRQFEANPQYVIIAFASFNQAADEFYSHLQGLKASRQVHQRENVASRKLEATKRDQAQRLESLQATQRTNARKAAAIVASQDWVQAALDAVNEQLQAGTDWEDLAHLIASSAASDPVAALIQQPLRLADQTVTLRLPEPGEADNETNEGDYDSGDEDYFDEDTAATAGPPPTIDVDVKLTLSAWANARAYYDQKRVAAVKEKKTKEVTSLALRNAEKKVAKELRSAQNSSALLASGLTQPRRIRRQLWFEKFLWFISSDGYLVLAAREAQQAEMLYRHHLRSGDIYVHADIRGAPGIVIVKNQRAVATDGASTNSAAGSGSTDDDALVPPSTLAQAGCLAVCASEAWETKAGLGAYWVRSSQVFKTTRTGDLLLPGAFDIRGEKNHLPPPQRVLGFGLLFRVNRGDGDATLGDMTEGVSAATAGEAEELAAPEETSEVDAVAEKLSDSKSAGNSEKEDKEAEEKGEEEVEETDEKNDESTEQVNKEERKGKDHKHPLRALSPTPSRASTINTNNGPKRGQRGKAKKLAKYKDQDDEDRVRAEQLVGIAAGREKAAAKVRAKTEREAQQAALDARHRAQREKQMQAMRAYEATRQAAMTGGAAGASAEEASNGSSSANINDDAENSLSVLRTLVGRPAPGDTILEVVPTCAPWPALATGSRALKYKVKLQPGATKKGRAMRDVLERWRRAGAPRLTSGGDRGGGGNGGDAVAKPDAKVVDAESRDPERMWPREIELLSGLKMEEAANCVMVSKMTALQTGGFGGGSGGGGGGGGTKRSGGKGSGGVGGGKKTKK